MRLDEAKLMAYLDGELSEQERRWVEKQLADSPQFQDRLDQLSRETEQVNQALDLLSPTYTSMSASLALKQLKSFLAPADQAVPSPEGVHSEDSYSIVWESPSLWSQIKTGFKNLRVERSQPMSESIRRSRLALVTILILMIPAITIAFVLLFNTDPGPAGYVMPGGGQSGDETEVPPSPVSIKSSFILGIQVDPLGDTEANIDHVKALGFEWVKFQMTWKNVEPAQGSYDWTGWDEVIGAYADSDIKVLLSIPKAPDWARPADDDKSVEGPPADPATYAEFVSLVADRYRDQVQAIEIWDEQNMWYKAGGKGRVHAEAYVELLRQAYQAIKAVNEDIIVISGAMSPAGNVPDLAVDDVDYLQQMYANDAKDYFDALGAHPSGYNCPALADWRTFEDDTAVFRGPFEYRHHSWCFLGTMQAYREVMVANADGDKAIWVTEFGWAVSDSPESGYQYAEDNTYEEQAQWIIEAYQWAEKQTWVGPMFLWNLDYSLTAPDTALADFSILDTPAYDALINMNKANSEEK